METIIANLPKIFLLIGSGLFFYYGSIGLTNPVDTVSPMEISISSNISKTEIRATYGGLLLGIGGFMLYAALFNLKVGLIAVVVIVGGIGITRLCSIFYDHSQSYIQWYLLSMELVSVSIALILLFTYYGIGNGKNT